MIDFIVKLEEILKNSGADVYDDLELIEFDAEEP